MKKYPRYGIPDPGYWINYFISRISYPVSGARYFISRIPRPGSRIPDLVSYILVIFCLLIFSSAAAQLPLNNPVIYSLTEENGLSDNNTTCLYEDTRGVMWIGTINGLSCYDGSVFRNYTFTGHPPLTVPDNHIYSITEDSSHRIWIGTGSGLAMYDPKADSFHSWRVPSPVVDINHLRDLLVDKDGYIWIASYSGLLRFDPRQQQFTTYINNTVPSGEGRGRNNRLNKIHIDKEQRFWLCTYNGLWRFFPGDHHFEQYISEKSLPTPESLLISLVEDHAGRIWLGSYSNGLLLFDPGTRTVSDYFGSLKTITNISAICESKDMHGNYQLNTGTMDFDPVKKTFHSVYRPASVADAFIVNACYVTHDNLLCWATDKGVKIIDPLKQFFHHYYLSEKKLTDQSVCISQAGKNMYVGGAQEHFLTLYDDSFRVLKSIPPPKSGNREYIGLLNIVREDEQHIWLCTEHGLFLHDERTGFDKAYFPSKEDGSGMRDFISNMLIDSKGIHWVFPWRSGIWQVDKDNGKFKKVFGGLSVENSETKKLVISAAAEDHNGNIWFADLDEGLILYDRRHNSFSKPLENKISPRFRLVNIYFEAPWIWCVLNGKIFRIHTDTKELQEWNIPDEFNNQVNDFCSDHAGYLWILTNKGLLSFNKTRFAFKRYTANDGLLDNVLNETIWPLQNGNLLYAGKNYVTVFDPVEIMKSNAIPPVRITTVLSQDKPLEIRMRNTGEKYIELNHTYSNFAFNWAALNYSNPLQNQYYCKLEDVDNDWKYVGNKGQAQYSSLSPGKYVFRMRGASSDGVMNEKGDSIIIIIHPPFWKTWWFVLLCIFFISFMVYMLYKYRVEESLKRERLRTRIATDLHDDIGSTLSSISILSEMALREPGEAQAQEMVKEIRDNSVLLMEKMDDIVWSINPGNDSLENLLVRIRRFASRLFEARNIDYDISIAESVRHLKLSMENRQHIYLLLKEAINNLVKYADCSKASIQVQYEQGLLKIRVSDNGKGFDKQGILPGNGLLSMQNRARMMKGRLDISSSPGAGTTVMLEAKIK